jgi:hypothetical protein
MARRALALIILLNLIEVCAVVLVFTALNFLILAPNIYFREYGIYLRAYDWFFFEGILCLVLSALFAFGRGGIDAYTVRSARTRALADAVSGEDHGTSGTFRKDRWRPEGFPKAALVLLITGIVLLIIYSLTLNYA